MTETIKTVFILGAGASKQAGVPLMREFLDVARDLRRVGRVGVHAADFERVFQALSDLQVVQSKARFDLVNIETIFSAFEFARVIQSFCGYNNDQIAALANAAKNVIAHTIEETLRFPLGADGPIAPRPYAKFANLVKALTKSASPVHRPAIITFNYDFALDFVFRDVQIDFGLGEQGDSRSLISLLKLHGSVNWARCAVCGEIRQVRFQDFVKDRGVIDRIDVFRFGHSLNLQSHCHTRVDPQPVIVPPSWNKTAHHEQLSHVWSAVARELAAADNIIIIGYSLPDTDMFFRQLYALGTVGPRLLERVWVFDPDESGIVRRRFEELLGRGAEQRFRFFQETFDPAISHVAKEFHVSASNLQAQ